MDSVSVLAIIASLRTEEATLDTVLQSVPEYRRLRAVQTSIAALVPAYGIHSAVPANPIATHSLFDLPQTAQKHRARANSQGAQVTTWSEAVFRETKRRHQSPALLAEFETRGWGPITAPNPTGYIASTLSHDERFDNAFDEYGRGYGLREWSVAKTTQNVPLNAQTPSGEASVDE